MATQNDDGAPPEPSSGEEAFAATVAPQNVPSPPTDLASGTRQPAPSKPPVAAGVDATVAVPSQARVPSHAPPATGIDATVAADLVGTLPPLPEVSAALYQTGNEIARGGMGRIVAAQDVRLGRKVALKELLDPTGEGPGGEQTTRFQREALITARLQHPGIVPVYEAGRWPTGEPFFAMKLVAGKPLDQVIAVARTLDDRLALVPRVAAASDAIAYAHSQRIIHRDLKPGNVLVGEFGETVVIDWGLAKDLDAVEAPESFERQRRRPSQKDITTTSSTLTVAGAVMGTPAYMAPEQARGEPLDQRADVFALGAMLYHVLAGVAPYRAKTATDVIAAAALGKVIPIGEREKRAPRELVTIVERAMAQAPADRYPDAGAFAEDLRRFLTGRLVGAHHYTPLQRVGRFVKKHRGAVTVATIAIAGFAVGGTIAVHNVVTARDRAQVAERVARTRGSAAERLIDYMMTNVQRQLTQIGRLDLMAGLSSEVKQYYATLTNVPGGMPADDERRMAEAIELIGRAEHQSGKPDRALATWSEAKDKLEGLVGTDRSARTLEQRVMIAKLDYETGTVYLERGRYDQAASYFTRAGGEYAALRVEAPGSQELMLGEADNDDQLGDMLRRQGKLDDALAQYNRAKTLREGAHAADSADDVMARSTSHGKLGSLYQSRGESELAAAEYKQALDLRESVAAREPDNALVQQALLDTLEQLAVTETSLGDDASALARYQRALPIAQLLAQRDPTNTDWEWQRGNVLADLGQALVATGRFQAGLDQLDRSVDVHRGLATRDPKTARYKTALSRSLVRDGDALLALGKLDDALARYKEAADLRHALLDGEPASVAFRRSYGGSLAKLAAAYAAKGATVGALDADKQALAIRSKLAADSPSQGDFKNELAATEIEYGRLAADPKLVASGLSLARALIANDPNTIEWKETLVQGLLAEGAIGADRTTALDEARATAEAAVARSPENVFWPGYLAEAYAGLGQLEKARDVLAPLARAGRLPATRQALLK